MSDEKQLQLLKNSVPRWNEWREENTTADIDLVGADLRGANLGGAYLHMANMRGANLREAFLLSADLRNANLREADISRGDLWKVQLNGANLRQADLSYASLGHADLSGADLRGANLAGACLTQALLCEAKLRNSTVHQADLSMADLRRADLCGAHLWKTDLSNANLTEANVSDADLSGANLVQTKLTRATLTNSNIFGISAWKLDLDGLKSSNLRITREDEPDVRVDNLLVAQFVYLMLENPHIRDVIDTIGEKGVLILGRFTKERKVVLDAIRDRLRGLGFVPMMFDFDRPKRKDFTETIMTLAGMSRFIIADITNPKSSPLELQAIMPNYRVPLVPIIQEGEEPFSMFRDLNQKYGEWVLDILEYDQPSTLSELLDQAVVEPALKMSDELLKKKTEEITKRHISDYKGK